VPEVIVTVSPVEMTSELRMISAPEPDAPTVRPPTITVPALLRSSASAAVPAVGVLFESGVPPSVNMLPETLAAGFGRVNVAITPVAPESEEVPITSEPADPAPVDAFTVLLVIKSATSCILFVFSVDEYVTAIVDP
jgi:hypothetical protein